MVIKFSPTRRSDRENFLHRPGRTKSNADALSRRPCYTSDCKYCGKLEKKEILNDNNPLPEGKETDDKTTMRVTVDDKTPLKIWSREELIALQNEDPDIGPLLRWETKYNRVMSQFTPVMSQPVVMSSLQ